ncbi:MAG: hypothetical protein ACI3WT_04355 [Phascolarctobacterium sp.]
MHITLSVVLRQTKKGIIVIVPGFDTTVITTARSSKEALISAQQSLTETMVNTRKKTVYCPNQLSVPLKRGDTIDNLYLSFNKKANQKPNLKQTKTELTAIRMGTTGSTKSGIFNIDIFRKHN